MGRRNLRLRRNALRSGQDSRRTRRVDHQPARATTPRAQFWRGMSCLVTRLDSAIRAIPAFESIHHRRRAAFIGSNLVDRLLADGVDVVGYDNFSTGQQRFLDPGTCDQNQFTMVEADTLRPRTGSRAAMSGCDFVFHLAANADVRFGIEHPRRDLEQNTIATFNVLEAMRANGIKRIAFSSTGSIYGEPDVHPYAGKRAVPDPDLALRRIETRVRRIYSRLLRGVRVPGLHFPLRVGPRRAVLARPCVRLLPAAAGEPE